MGERVVWGVKWEWFPYVYSLYSRVVAYEHVCVVRIGSEHRCELGVYTLYLLCGLVDLTGLM